MSVLSRLMAVMSLCVISFLVYANPVLDHVAAGQASITQTPNSTVINQGSQQAIINWQSFNIGQQESTHFQQPAGGVALNRISPNQGPSSVYGRLTATGQIILSNPAGIYFGPTAYVNVGGLIATTMDISNQDFLSGQYRFMSVPGFNGAIVNQGTIIAADHGLVALVGGAVTNEGFIQANLGKVVLASGDAFTMTFAGNDMVGFTVDEPTAQASIANTGTLQADGGQILVTARGAQQVLDQVINLDGVLRARSIAEHDGEVIIKGDESIGITTLAGLIDVSGFGAGTSGGNVTVTGYNILLASTSAINASGEQGGGQVLIGGNYQGKGPLAHANALVMVKGAKINADALSHGNGGQIVLWSDQYTRVAGDLAARGGVLSGDGGLIETSSKNLLNVNEASVDTSAPQGHFGTWLLDPTNIWIASSLANAQTAGMVGSDSSASTGPTTFAASGAVNDSYLSTSTLQTALASNNITVTTTNASGSGDGDITVVDPITWTSTNSLSLTAAAVITINAAISGVNGSLLLSAGSSSNITTNSSGSINVANFTLQQGNWSQNMGSLPAFNVGNDFSINNGTFLRVAGGDGSGSPYQLVDIYGLQGVNTLLNNNFVLNNDIDATNTLYWNAGEGFRPIAGYQPNGAFTGTFDGQNHVIDNLYINAAFAPNQLSYVGLFGSVNNASISNVGITNATVIVDSLDSLEIGILAGELIGTSSVSNSFVTGSITVGSASSPKSTNGGMLLIGGLVGGSLGSITDSFADVDITTYSSDSSNYIGGLVGISVYSTPSILGSIDSSYASGNIQFASSANSDNHIGGLVGYNMGTITDSYSTVGIAAELASGGTLSAGGLVGITDSRTGDTNPLLTNTYATGSVSASGSGTLYQGGIIGYAASFNGLSGGIVNSFWDTATTGQNNAIGYNEVGFSTLQAFAGTFNGSSGVNLLNLSTYSGPGWDITGTVSTTATAPTQTWFIFNGATRPMLMSEYSTTIRNVHQLQLAGTTVGANYTLVQDIDLSAKMTNTADVWATNRDSSIGKGFVPIGVSFSANKPFTGTFDGDSYTISNLYINQSGGNGVGFIARTNPSATISNLYLDNLYINNSAAGNTAGLIGFADDFTTITNVYLSGEITGTSGGNIGGVVGSTNGPITFSNVFSTVNVTTTTASNVGGLIGFVSGGTVTIGNVYAVGSVAGGSYVGGLIGLVSDNTNVTNSYSSGVVSGSSNLGGLIGGKTGGTLNVYNSFWDSDTSGQLTSAAANNVTVGNAGYRAMTTAAMMTLDNFIVSANGYVTSDNAWSITNTPSTTTVAPSETWFLVEGGTRPILMSEYSTNIKNAHQLQLISSTLGGSYTLDSDIDLTTAMTNIGDIWASNSNTSTGKGFAPIGDVNSATYFKGSFDGQDNTVSNLYINNPTGYGIGLFAAIEGEIGSSVAVMNLGVHGSITGSYEVGLLAGSIFGPAVVSNVHSAGSVTSTGSAGLAEYTTGGLLGEVGINGTVINSYNIASVTNTADGGRIGGLVGSNGGGIINSYNLGTVTVGDDATEVGGLVGSTGSGNYTTILSSYNSGNVIAGNNATYIGGLVGRQTIASTTNTISSSYNTGAVIVGTNSSNVGGLVGAQENLFTGGDGTITQSYSMGLVSAGAGSSAVGGFIGLNSRGSGAANTINVTSSFWDTDYSNQSVGFGSNTGTITNLSGGCYDGSCSNGGTATLRNLSTYSSAPYSWSIVDSTDSYDGYTWAIVDGISYPYLVGSNSGTPINTSAPRIISGTAPSGEVISLLVDGDLLASMTSRSSDGFFYFMQPQTLIADGANIIAFITSSSTKANAIFAAPSDGSSITGISLTVDTVSLNGTSLSNANIASAYGSYVNASDILFSVDGSNNLTISNNYHLATISGLTYQLEGNITATGTGDVTIAGPLQLNNNVSIAGDVITISGNVTGLTSTRNLTINNAGTSTLSGSLTTNIGSLSKSGSGALTISNTGNSYTGATNINAGTVIINAASNLGSTSSVNITNATLQSAATLSLSAAFSLGAGTSILSIDNGTTTTLTGAITGAGNLAKSGTGTLILSNNSNSYSGKTTISAGTLSISSIANVSGGNSALGAPTTAGNGTIDIGATGVLTYTGSGHSSNRVINLTGSDVTVNASGSGALTLTGGITGNTFNLVLGGTGSGLQSGVIATTTGTVTKQDAGTWTFGNTNTYTGITYINGGSLSISAAGNVSNSSNINIAGGTLLSTATLSLSNPISLGAGTNTFSTNGGTTTTLTGAVSGTGNLTKSGTGTLVLNNTTNSYVDTNISAGVLSLVITGALGTGNTNITSGSTLQINYSSGGDISEGGVISVAGTGSSGQGAIYFTSVTNNKTLNNSGGITLTGDTTIGADGDAVINAVISGNYALTKNGSQTLVLGGTNSYTGLTTVSQGIISLTNSSALGTTDNGTIFTNGASMEIQGSNLTFNEDILGISGFGVGGGGAIRNDATNTVWNGSITIDNNQTMSVWITNPMTINGNISGTGVNSQLYVTGNSTLNIAGNITGTINLNNATSSPGFLTVSGTGNTYSGTTSITSGTLKLGANNALPTGTTVSIGGGLTFDLNGFSQQVGSLSGTGTITTTGGASTLTINNSSNLNFAGSITGAVGITKIGSSTLTLSGSNSYTGATTISAGTLAVGVTNGVSTSSIVDIANGAVFDLSGFAQQVAGLSNTGSVTSSSAATLTVNSSSDTSFSGAMSGAIGLTKTGANTLTLLGSNTYTGATNINAGTLALGSSTSLPAATTLTINNNAVLQAASSVTVSPDINIGSGGGQLNAALGAVMTVNGTINGANALTLSGLGSIILNANVGSVTRLASILSNANTRINAANVLTTGNQQYNSPLTIGGNVTLNSVIGNGAISLAIVDSSAAGTNSLSLSSGSGLISLTNAIGGNAALNSFSLTSTNTSPLLIGSSINTSGSGNNISISAGGVITETVSGLLNTTTASLSATGGMQLTGVNTISNFSATNTGSGNILLTNNGNLVISSISQANGNINVINNNGTLTTTGAVTTTGGNVTFNTFTTSATAQKITIGSGGISTGGGNISLTGANNSTGSAISIEVNGVLSTLPNTADLGQLIINGGVNMTVSPVLGDGDIFLSGSGKGLALGNLTFNRSLSFSADDVLSITGPINTTGSATITFTGTNGIDIDGALTASGTGGFIFDSDGPINLRSSVTTNGGSQEFNGPVSVVGDITLTFNGTGTKSILFNDAVSGGGNLTISGNATGTNNFSFGGGLALNNVTISAASGSTDNTLSIDNNGAPIWNITGDNLGNVSGISGVSGNFNFSNIQNLSGSANGDVFYFVDGAKLTGTINGGTDTGDVFNYTNHSSPISVVLSSTNDGRFDSDLVTLGNFRNIDSLMGNASVINSLTLPNKANSVMITAYGAGSVNDPIYFTNFQQIISLSGVDSVVFANGVVATYDTTTGIYTVNGVSMSFPGFTYDQFSGSNYYVFASSAISNIIEQPIFNEGIETPLALNGETSTNINEVVQKQAELATKLLNETKVATGSGCQ